MPLTFSLLQYSDMLQYNTIYVAYETEIDCMDVLVFHTYLIEDTFGYQNSSKGLLEDLFCSASILAMNARQLCTGFIMQKEEHWNLVCVA